MSRRNPATTGMRVACACLPLLALPAAALAQGADAGLAHKGAVSLASVLQMITGLLAVLALIFAGAWALKRFGRMQGTAHEQLRLVGGINLGQRERIVIVQAGSDRLRRVINKGLTRDDLAKAAVDVSRIQPKLTLAELKQPFLDRIEKALYREPF